MAVSPDWLVLKRKKELTFKLDGEGRMNTDIFDNNVISREMLLLIISNRFAKYSKSISNCDARNTECQSTYNPESKP